MQPLGLPTAFFDHRLAVSRQITLLAGGPLRNERRADKTMLDQLRPPLRVSDISLAARNVTHVTGVDHPHRGDSVLEDPVNRFPIHASRFHPNQRHVPFDQPVRQQQQLRRRRAELSHLLAAAARPIRRTRARHHRVPVHVQERAPLNNNLHHRLLPSKLTCQLDGSLDQRNRGACSKQQYGAPKTPTSS